MSILAILLSLINFRMFAFDDGTGGTGGGAAEGGAEGGSTEGGAEGGGGTNYEYPETFSPDLHGAGSITKFANEEGKFDVGQIMNSYVHLERKFGADKVVKPKDGATPEEWRDFHRSVGLPEAIENYDIKNELPEGFEQDPEMFDFVKKSSFEAGLLPHQAQKLISDVNNFQVDRLKANEASSNEAAGKVFDGLKNEWGDKYSERVNAANTVIENYAGEELAKELEDSGVFKSPSALKFLDRLAQESAESGVIDTRNTKNAMSVYDVRKEMEDMYREGTPFKNKLHPGHEKATERFLALNQMLVDARD